MAVAFSPPRWIIYRSWVSDLQPSLASTAVNRHFPPLSIHRRAGVCRRLCQTTYTLLHNVRCLSARSQAYTALHNDGVLRDWCGDEEQTWSVQGKLRLLSGIQRVRRAIRPLSTLPRSVYQASNERIKLQPLSMRSIYPSRK